MTDSSTHLLYAFLWPARKSQHQLHTGQLTTSHNNYAPASVDVATQVIITATVPGSGGSIGTEARVDIVPWGCGHLIGDASGPALPVPAGLPLPYMRAAAGGSAETAAAARAAEAQAVLML